MQEALILANKAYEIDEVPVGAIAVYKNKVVGRGYNQVINKKDITAHAEILAIKDAAKTLGNYRLLDTTIYSTLEPCHMCAKAMVDARIKKLIFAAKEPKHGSLVSIDNIFERIHLNHSVEFKYGLLSEESSTLLKKFFKSKR